MNIKILYFCKKENYKNKYIGEIFYKDYDIINKIKPDYVFEFRVERFLF